MGQSLIALGRAAEAVPPLTRAMNLRERPDTLPEDRGETRFAMAQALWETGADRTRALRLASAGRDDYAKEPGASAKLAAVDKWLAAHRR
jgi:hypothetical protein